MSVLPQCAWMTNVPCGGPGLADGREKVWMLLLAELRFYKLRFCKTCSQQAGIVNSATLPELRCWLE